MAKAKKQKKSKKSSGIRHHHITRVLYVALVGFAISTGIIIYAYSQTLPARAAVGFLPYGGYVDTFVVNLTAAGLPNPTCPIYSVISNVDPTNGLPPEFGVFIPPTLPAPTYDYNNLYVPGTPVLGGLVPVPNLACLAPIPVYPLYYNLPDPFYLTGTGAF